MFMMSLVLAATLSPAAPALGGDANLTWFNGAFDDALTTAESSGKPVCVYFWSNGSEQCARMYQETMAAEGVVHELNDVVLFSANTGEDNGYALVERFNVRTLPTVLFVTPAGQIDDAVVGYIDPGGFSKEIQRFKSGKDTITDFRRRAAAAPEDVETQYAFSVKLADCGDKQGAEEITERLRQLDPKGKTLTVARILLSDVQKPLVKAAKSSKSELDDGNYDFANVSLKPLEKFIAKSDHNAIRFDGWNWIAEVNMLREDHASARKASMKAWEFASEEESAYFGRKVARGFFEQQDQLNSKEKKFALKVALAAHKATLANIESKLSEATATEGCTSADGCSEGEGCGGCSGLKGKLAQYEADALDAVACAYYLNGRAQKALEAVERSVALAPEAEHYKARLAAFRSH